jgi:hypothetical protein
MLRLIAASLYACIYSIAKSARSRMEVGGSMPSNLAVLRLIADPGKPLRQRRRRGGRVNFSSRGLLSAAR